MKDESVICAEAGGVEGEQKVGMDKFRADFKAKYNADVQVYAPYVYDAVKVMATAMVNAGSSDPAKYLPHVEDGALGGDVVQVDLNRPMADILAELTKHPIKTRLSLTGSLIVARDLAHAKLRELLDRGEPLPDYFKNHPVYYAGPAKTPDGMPSGSFGPTTAGRMDSFVDQFQAAGGSMVMVAKGNRAVAVREACKKHGGFYLGSIGGAAANLAEHCIKKVEVVEYPELGMEAIWRIEVVDFPAFIIIDDKGNDFFKELNLG
jgi:fumarate hydratase class I